jgi:hypothetical protein
VRLREAIELAVQMGEQLVARGFVAAPRRLQELSHRAHVGIIEKERDAATGGGTSASRK